LWFVGEGSFVPLERLEVAGGQATITSLIPNRVVPVKDILPLTLTGTRQYFFIYNKRTRELRFS
jgi:hypothetical protein